MDKEKGQSQQSLTPSHSQNSHAGEVIKVGNISLIIINEQYNAIELARLFISQSALQKYTEYFPCLFIRCPFTVFISNFPFSAALLFIAILFIFILIHFGCVRRLFFCSPLVVYFYSLNTRSVG